MASNESNPGPAEKRKVACVEDEDEPYPVWSVTPTEWQEEGLEHGWQLLTIDEIRKRYIDRKAKEVRPIEVFVVAGKPWNPLLHLQKPARFRWIPTGEIRSCSADDLMVRRDWLFSDDAWPRHCQLMGVKKWHDVSCGWSYGGNCINKDGSFTILPGGHLWTLADRS